MLSLTLKIQPDAKWHNKAPVNGRPFVMDDLMFSWRRFIAKGRDHGAVANSANPEAPVLSFTAVDSSTAVIKLKEPTCYLLALFAPTTVGKMVIIPKETDTTFSIEKDMIGTGPYILTDYKPSIGMTFKKAPTTTRRTSPSSSRSTRRSSWNTPRPSLSSRRATSTPTPPALRACARRTSSRSRAKRRT